MPLGYLIDTIYTRDVWMHRVDVCGATGHSLVFDADHDGRIVAAIVSDWASCHGQTVRPGTGRAGRRGISAEAKAGRACGSTPVSSPRRIGPGLHGRHRDPRGESDFLMDTRIDEITEGIYRISTLIPEVAPPAGFNIQ